MKNHNLLRCFFNLFHIYTKQNQPITASLTRWFRSLVGHDIIIKFHKQLWCWNFDVEPIRTPIPGCHDVTWLFWPTWGWNGFQVWNYWVKDLFCWLFCWTESANLVRPGGLVLHDGPGLSIVTVSHFKSWDKLDGPKVFGALRDDPWNLLWWLQIHLKNQKPESRLEQQTDQKRS